MAASIGGQKGKQNLKDGCVKTRRNKDSKRFAPDQRVLIFDTSAIR
jgi:hypothetical protein